MCWSNVCIIFVLARVVCELNIAMRSSRTSAMKRTDGRAIGTECQGRGRLFGTLFAYDQHRRSRVLRGTACCAFKLPDKNRFNVTAAQRPNCDRTCQTQHWSADRPSAREVEDSKSIFCIFCRSCVLCNLKRAYPRG